MSQPLPGLLCEEGPPLFTVMTRDVATASPGDTVASAVASMASRGVGSVVVVDGDGRPVGIFTERDLLVKVVARGLDPAAVRLAEVMTSDPVVAREEWSAAKALEVMAYYGFRHLPVVDSTGRLVGVVSIKDVARSIVEEIDVSELSTAD